MTSPTHAVAIVGGATAGAEVASALALRGVEVAVFEMNPRPFGKIEDGLPRWHSALRKKEYDNIRGKLDHPNVRFVPNTKVGRDVELAELERVFSAVVLASGAWRDRPLPFAGADDFVGKGLVYQNPFIIAFNRGDDVTAEVPDDAVVVGGGLASIDVVKLLSIEWTRKKLAARGIESDVEEMERKGIPATLAEHGLTFEGLGLKGPQLYYRRRPEDMPLMEAPEGATPERLAKVEASRRKILEKAKEKFLFRFEGLASPAGPIVENGRLVGLVFDRVRQEGKKLVNTGEKLEARGSAVVSSIGSIPEPIRGVTMKGELFPFEDWELGRMPGHPKLLAAGNVVTGKGNIIASRRHAENVAQVMIEDFLGLTDRPRSAEAGLENPAAARAAAQAAEIGRHIERLPAIGAEDLAAARAIVAKRQAEVGITSFRAWCDKVVPPGFA